MAVTLPNVYDLIVSVENSANSMMKWRNTFTFYSGGSPAPGVGIIAAIGGFMEAMVRSDSTIVEFSCYNWARGRQPYPLGQPIFTITTAIQGTADSNWTSLTSPYSPVGGEVVMRVDHQPEAGGKPGRNFFRGLFGERDLSSITGGNWATVPSAGAIQTNLETILTASGLKNFFGPFTPGPGTQVLAVVRYSKKLGTVFGYVPITDFRFVAVSTSKRTRKSRR